VKILLQFEMHLGNLIVTMSLPWNFEFTHTRISSLFLLSTFILFYAETIDVNKQIQNLCL